MVNEEIVGTDVDVNWILDTEGDLLTTSGSDNMAQQIYLRLTCYFNSMSWCYDSFGSYLKDYFGKNNTEDTRSSLLREVLDTVMQDPRVEDAEVELKDWEVGDSLTKSSWIGLKIKVWVENKSYEDYYIFGNLPRKNDMVKHSDYMNTHIDTNPKGYYAVRGGIVRVHCHVLDEKNRRVPVGEVGLSIGGYFVNIDDNPQEISQSGSREPGSNTFEFRLPYFIEEGEHKLIFRYKGIKGYNPSITTTRLYVVDRIPTHIHYLYPNQNRQYYLANDVDDFTDPKTYIIDYNDARVTHGEVRYYIDDGGIFGNYTVIDSPIIYMDDVLQQIYVIIRARMDVLDFSSKMIFNLTRMFHTHDIITLKGADGTEIDYLEVNKKYGVYFLTSADLIFKEEKLRKANCDVALEVIE